jgi:hypothetical protein
MAVAGKTNWEPSRSDWVSAGTEGLRLVEGQNVIVDYRFAEGRSERIVDLTNELVRLRPDVLAVVGSVVMRAIRDMTGNTPVVLLSQIRSEQASSPVWQGPAGTSLVCR